VVDYYPARIRSSNAIKAQPNVDDRMGWNRRISQVFQSIKDAHYLRICTESRLATFPARGIATITKERTKGGAGRGNRTPMTLRSADFESAASASSAIPAWALEGEMTAIGLRLALLL
jgi:hypothetical protein